MYLWSQQESGAEHSDTIVQGKRTRTPRGLHVIQNGSQPRAGLWGWQESTYRVGYAFRKFVSLIAIIKRTDPMTNRVSYAPQDLQKMCKQAERDQESKKLVVLIERVKRQIAEREHPGEKKPRQAAAVAVRLPSRSVPLER